MKTKPDRTYHQDSPAPRRMVAQMAILIACRLLLNTGRRFIYPFAPAFSRALGVPLTAITSLIAVNWATSLIGIASGPIADRWGYRRMMTAGLFLLAVGLLTGGALGVYGSVMVGLFLAGLGKSVFDPAVQAYVSDRVPFRRRGLAIGMLEVSWAASALVGIPLVAFLIDRGGWRAPFFVLALLGGLGMLALTGFVASDSRPSEPASGKTRSPQLWKKIIHNRMAMGAFGYTFFVQMANDNLFVVYGAWMEQAFHLSIVGIGLGTSVIGAAELAGEFATAALSDRIGLKRGLIIGLILCTLGYLLLPLLTGSLSWALVGLFFLFLIFEFSVVTGLSLATELVPEARATMMSGFFAAGGIGRVAGALIGGPIWIKGGMTATASVSAAINLLALLSLIWGLKGWKRFEKTHGRG